MAENSDSDETYFSEVEKVVRSSRKKPKKAETQEEVKVKLKLIEVCIFNHLNACKLMTKTEVLTHIKTLIKLKPYCKNEAANFLTKLYGRLVRIKHTLQDFEKTLGQFDSLNLFEKYGGSQKSFGSSDLQNCNLTNYNFSTSYNRTESMQIDSVNTQNDKIEFDSSSTRRSDTIDSQLGQNLIENDSVSQNRRDKVGEASYSLFSCQSEGTTERTDSSLVIQETVLDSVVIEETLDVDPTDIVTDRSKEIDFTSNLFVNWRLDNTRSEIITNTQSDGNSRDFVSSTAENVILDKPEVEMTEKMLRKTSREVQKEKLMDKMSALVEEIEEFKSSVVESLRQLSLEKGRQDCDKNREDRRSSLPREQEVNQKILDSVMAQIKNEKHSLDF